MNTNEAIEIIFAPKKTFRQKLNYFSAILNRKLKKLRLYNYPIKLTIDPSNYCNLQCVLCPVGRTKTLERKQAFMDFDLFKKIIDECGDYLWSIDMYNWGEPLLNKNISAMIKYAKKKKIDIIISTNLNYFNETICTELIASGLDILIVSLFGASQESVEKYQKGCNFELVTNNIKHIVKIKKELKADKPLIQWRFVINKFNEKEIEMAVIMSKLLQVDKLELLCIRCSMANELFWDSKTQYKNIKPWLPINENLSMYDYEKEQKKIIKKRCGLLWTESVIHPNGSVSPCCAIWPEKYDFGNVTNISFKEIWNNQQYQNARQIARGEKLSTTSHICYICNVNNAQI